MAYNRNIPAATDLISNSQSAIQANFQAIDSGTTQTGIGFARNHVSMTDATNGGLHNRIDFFQNIAAPTLTGFIASLYPVNVSGSSELQYTNASGSTQITHSSLPIWKGGTVGTNGVATVSSSNLTLPNGLQFSYGTANTDGSGNATVTFNFPNNLFSATLTRVITGGNNRGYIQWASTPTRTSGAAKMLDSSGNNLSGTFYWIAIGN